VVAATPYRNRQSGTADETTVFLFYTGVSLDPSKRVASVTLPGAVNGGPLHIFAMSIGTPATQQGAPQATASATPAPAKPQSDIPRGFVRVPSPPRLSSHLVAPGESLVGTAMVWNPGKTAVSIHDIVIAGRPPHATNAGGPFDDFGGTGPVTLKPGQRLTIHQTRKFTASDPKGVWRTFVTYQTPDGLWHDDARNTTFVVATPAQSAKKPVAKATAARTTPKPTATRQPARPTPTATVHR
jgi:hypothetical protein